tara:strand:+ start:969 stop:2699 length:1731 start_codon:yes stop_codon:yes gene_type:complete
MGIKHAFWWFKNRYSEHIKSMRSGQSLSDIDVSIDNLMVDMNGVFHNSAQKIYQYGSYKPPPRLLPLYNPRKRQPGLKAQLRLFEDVCGTIESLFTLTGPRKRLILCVDGPAPLSKQNQQRQRRFRSAKEADENCVFDSNSITPGTKFMDHLTKYIDWYLRKKITTDQRWRDIEIIFSNEKAPGEGEHKIINYIRYYGDQDETYCIHGMDADLIMLSLGTHLPNFYILRDDVFDSAVVFNCVNVGVIRNLIISELKWSVGSPASFDGERAINDFIFLFFMVGNDFLPHIPSIEIIEDGIELILEVYKDVCKSHGHITRVASGRVEFCPGPLAAFLGTIGHHEQENLERKVAKKKSFFPDPLLEKCSRQGDKGSWHVDIATYKQLYLEESFPVETGIGGICHDYLEGMQWVLSYYTRGVPNWRWSYKYHYAPPASVLAQHIATFEFPKYGRTLPSTPFQQLLCVLPPASADLIPPPLSGLLTDERSPLRQYCPDDFAIDLSGKRREWEGIVILPMVNFDLVVTNYSERVKQVAPKELKRNVCGRSFKYEFDSGSARTFASFYGDIENCGARPVLIDL